MEYKQPTQSVLARLMGLDELPPLQPVQKRQRVLSDNYLQRVASIGVKEKHVECHSFRLNVDEQKEYLDIFRLLRTSKRAKHKANWVRKSGAQFPSDANISQKSMEGKPVSVDEKNISRSKVDVADLRTLVSIPATRIVLLKPHLGKLDSAATYSSPSACSHKSSHSEVRKHKGILGQQISDNLVEVDKSKNQATGMGSFRPRSRFSKETARKMGSISAETPQSKVIGEKIFAEDSTSRKTSSHNLSDFKNKTFCSERLNGIERWTTTQKLGCDLYQFVGFQKLDWKSLYVIITFPCENDLSLEVEHRKFMGELAIILPSSIFRCVIHPLNQYLGNLQTMANNGTLG